MRQGKVISGTGILGRSYKVRKGTKGKKKKCILGENKGKWF